MRRFDWRNSLSFYATNYLLLQHEEYLAAYRKERNSEQLIDTERKLSKPGWQA